jgi:uncharacterized protein YndB with AHSA1/START domain
MKRDLHFEAVYPYPRERVWRALTHRDELAQWLMANDFEAKPGQKFQFHSKPRPGFDGTVHCEVVEIEEPRQLAYRWVSGSLNTVVRFLLEAAEDGGTRLILEHSGFDGAGGLMMSALLSWNRMLREKLPAVVGGKSLSSVQCNVDIVSALIERYERGAMAFAELMGRISPDLLHLAPAEGEWSAHQTALHIVDAEIVGAMRLRMLAAQPGSTLMAYAGDVWGRELVYAKQPLPPSLELFQALRRTTAAMLRLIPVTAWANRAEHEEAGEVTLESYFDSHCEHAEVHLQEIEALVKKLSAALVASEL